MKSPSLSRREWSRLQQLRAAMLGTLGALLAALWLFQVARGEQYESNLERQSLRRVRLPGARGKIYDRHFVCLADNAPTFAIALFPEELRPGGRRLQTADAAWAAVQRIAAVTGLPPEVDPAGIAAHLYARKALPLMAWRRVGESALARLAEASVTLPGVDIAVESDRFYPRGALLGHLLGYAGLVEGPGAEETESYHYYLPDMAGRAGLEKQYDALLAGRPGGRLVQVDVAGYKHDEKALRDPWPGGDLQLAIDARVQQAAEQALAGCVGALVAVDPRNGDVLAMASAPGFDPNVFCPRLAPDDWRRLRDDPAKPLFNRALSGLYPPGSTFKPLVALAALGRGVGPDLAIDCQGSFSVGPQRLSCYQGIAHGPLGLRRAIEVSCNVYFFELGLRSGGDAIAHMARAAGLGERTGIGLDGEAAGLVPDRAWKRATLHEGWRDGDTCNLAIGQGALLVTPLQMALLTGALACHGRLYQPRLVLAVRPPGAPRFEPRPPVLRRTLAWTGPHLAAVQAGLHAVVQGREGSGRLARVPGLEMAGKTGTAEFGRKHAGTQHGWMLAYAPFDEPRLAAAMVLDEAVSGGQSVGPRMGAFMAAALQPAGPGEAE